MVPAQGSWNFNFMGEFGRLRACTRVLSWCLCDSARALLRACYYIVLSLACSHGVRFRAYLLAWISAYLDFSRNSQELFIGERKNLSAWHCERACFLYACRYRPFCPETHLTLKFRPVLYISYGFMFDRIICFCKN